MSGGHEPECFMATSETAGVCVCEILRSAYRRGYNDHAASRAYAEQVYGPYTQQRPGENP